MASTGTMRMSSDVSNTRRSDIPVLYLDDEVLVINKPSGLICDYDPKVQYSDSVDRWDATRRLIQRLHRKRSLPQ